jgi:hypothetical protein
MNGIRTRRASARRRKIIAVAAAGAVLLTGATVTSLASWLDEEWVTAGVDGDAGVSASDFEVEQQVQGDSAWFNRETGPGGVVDFDDLALNLSPGAVVYGWVSLRAADGSVGGTVGVVSTYTDGESLLGDVLTYGARLHASSATCTSGGYSGGTELVAPDTELEDESATTFVLPAGSGAAGTPTTVCFRIEFPLARADDALQGEEATPGWYFESTSS